MLQLVIIAMFEADMLIEIHPAPIVPRISRRTGYRKIRAAIHQEQEIYDSQLNSNVPQVGRSTEVGRPQRAELGHR